MSFADGDNGSLIVVLLQVNDSLDSPVNSQSALEHQASVHLARFHFQTLVIVELIVSLELRFDLSTRNVWSRRVLGRWLALLSETLVRLNARSVAEKLWSKQRSIAWNVTIRHLERKVWLARSFRWLSLCLLTPLCSACWPGFNLLPHSWHRRHSGCQSKPRDCCLSAEKHK